MNLMQVTLIDSERQISQQRAGAANNFVSPASICDCAGFIEAASSLSHGNAKVDCMTTSKIWADGWSRCCIVLRLAPVARSEALGFTHDAGPRGLRPVKTRNEQGMI
jgi:hypothetical protein